MKVKPWPIPDDNFEKLTLLGRLLYGWLPETKYKIMVRKHNMGLGMLIEDVNVPQFDAQYGKKLQWMKGWIPSNGSRRFELVEHSEPRDQKVPNTGELKDTRLSENDYFVLTARNSQALSDDEENFSWDVSETEISQYNNLKKHVDEKNIAISDLTDEINKYRMISTNLETQAETFSRESKRLHDKVNLLQQRNLDLEEQVGELYRQNKVLSTEKTRDESKLNEQEYNASKIGQLQGMDKIQMVQEAAKELNEMMSSFDLLLKRDDEEGSKAQVTLMDQMNEKFAEMQGQIDTVGKVIGKKLKLSVEEKI